MKEVKAFIRPHKLPSVTLELHQIDEVSGMSITEIRGFGRERARKIDPAVVQDLVDYQKYFRIEVVCSDEMESELVMRIEKALENGRATNGLIYVTDVSKTVRIGTGERGEKAIERLLDETVCENS